MEAGDQDLLHTAQEAFPIDGAIEEAWSRDPVDPQGSQEGQYLPVTVRDARFEPMAAHAPATLGRHVGLDPGRINEHRPRGGNPHLDGVPLPAFVGDVRLCGLFGVQIFFEAEAKPAHCLLYCAGACNHATGVELGLQLAMAFQRNRRVDPVFLRLQNPPAVAAHLAHLHKSWHHHKAVIAIKTSP